MQSKTICHSDRNPGVCFNHSCSHGNTKLSRTYPRPWTSAKVLFNPRLILSCCFQIPNKITPVLAVCRLWIAAWHAFLRMNISSLQGGGRHAGAAELQGGLAPQGAQRDHHCSSTAGKNEDASQAASNHTNSFKSYKWHVQPCHGFLFLAVVPKISEATCLKE